MKGVDYDKIVQSYLNLFQTSMNKASVKDNSENTKYAEYQEILTNIIQICISSSLVPYQRRNERGCCLVEKHEEY